MGELFYAQNGNYSVKAIGKSTEELKKLKLDGFEVREGEFDGYPVPVWTPAAAPEPITPPGSLRSPASSLHRRGGWRADLEATAKTC